MSQNAIYYKGKSYTGGGGGSTQNAIYYKGKSYSGGGSGNNDTYKYLCYGEQNVSQDNWVIGTIPLDVINDHSDDYDQYLSYDSSTKEFTVLKAFGGIITAWVYNGYLSTSDPVMRLQINHVQVASWSTNGSRGAGAKNGVEYVANFSIGDTIRLVNSDNQGWGFGRIKIYWLDDDTTDIVNFDEN